MVFPHTFDPLLFSAFTVKSTYNYSIHFLLRSHKPSYYTANASVFSLEDLDWTEKMSLGEKPFSFRLVVRLKVLTCQPSPTEMVDAAYTN